MQTWQASGESYFCRTTPQPEYMSTWLSPLSAASSRASYKGVADGSAYSAVEGEQLHHFQIKPLEAEHISLDFYAHLVGTSVLPAFVSSCALVQTSATKTPGLLRTSSMPSSHCRLCRQKGQSSTSQVRLIRST